MPITESQENDVTRTFQVTVADITSFTYPLLTCDDSDEWESVMNEGEAWAPKDGRDHNFNIILVYCSMTCSLVRNSTKFDGRTLNVQAQVRWNSDNT
jgi:hypothetical protein